MLFARAVMKREREKERKRERERERERGEIKRAVALSGVALSSSLTPKEALKVKT